MADLLPGNVSTIDSGGMLFWCPQVSQEGLNFHMRRCFFRPYRRWVRKPLRRMWWTARYLWYPSVRSYPCLFHRRVFRPFYKSRKHIIRQFYGQVKRYLRLEVKTLCSSIMFGSRRLRQVIRRVLHMGPSSRHRSSRGYRRWGRRVRRHRLAYCLILTCRSREFNLLPGSVHWRRNQRRLAYNRVSKGRSWIRTKQRFWNQTEFKGKNGHWNARPGILDHLASYPNITPSRIDSLFEHHCPLGAVFHEIELARAIQELKSAEAMAPEGDECGCGHEHCEHVVPRIPHPISEDTLAEETISDFLLDTDVLNVPRSVARFYSRDVLESNISSSFSSEDAERTVLRANLMATHLKTYEMNGGVSKPTFEDMPLIWDTGASSGLTPFEADFLTYEKCDIPIKDVSQTNRVIGMGLASIG